MEEELNECEDETCPCHLDDSEESEIDIFDEFPKATISFNINHNSNVDIRFDWDNKPETAVELGKLLFDLNTGSLAETITNILLLQMQQEPDFANFIEVIIQSWKNSILENKKILDTPAVHPLQTFMMEKD